MSEYFNPEARKHELLELVRNYLHATVEEREHNPMDLIQKLDAMLVSPAEYEALIPTIEKECVEFVESLQDYQLGVRGDSVTTKQRDRYETDVMHAPVIHNQRCEIATDQQRFDTLNNVMRVLDRAITVAYRYEGRKDPSGERKKPLLVYGFRRFNKQEKTKVVSVMNFEDQFGGETNDQGALLYDIQKIDLPPTPDISSETSPEQRKFFPLITEEAATDASEARLRKFSEGFADPVNAMILQHPKSYFNNLLLTFKIMCDLENYEDKISNPSQKS